MAKTIFNMMAFTGVEIFNDEIFLEDDRVLLRPLTFSDFDNLREFSTNEPDIWKYSLVQAIGDDGLKNYIDIALKAKAEGKEYPFIVFDKKEDAYAGSTRFYDIQPVHKMMQLGYTWYGKKFQGTGLNKHCKYLLLEFAFEKAGMQRVEFRADVRNERSIAAMKSIGCVEEGILRQNSLKPDGSFRDSIVLSILKSEWENKIKSHLKSQMDYFRMH